MLAFRWPLMIGIAILGFYFVSDNIPDTNKLSEATVMVKETFPGVEHTQWERTVNSMIKNQDHYPELAGQLKGLLGPTWSEQLRLTSYYGDINPERILPVVGVDALALPEAIRHGDNGFLAPAGDEAALAQHLGHLVSDVGLRKRMGMASRRLAEQHDLERVATQYEGLYRQVADVCPSSFLPAWIRRIGQVRRLLAAGVHALRRSGWHII